MEQNSIDITVKTENLINAIQNEPSIWDTKLSWRGPELPVYFTIQKVSLFTVIWKDVMSCHLSSSHVYVHN